MKTTTAKIALSDKELELVCNTEWILTKHAVIKKVYELLGNVVPQMENILLSGKNHLPAAVFEKGPKIAKGENYRLLPYVVLDYPRCFGQNNTIAIRTFFWWGNFFSVSLQLSGNYQSQLTAHLQSQFSQLKEKGCWICIDETPWEHHFETGNFRWIQSMTKEEFSAALTGKSFIKIAKKIPLQQWKEVPEFIEETFELFTGFLKFI